MYRAITPELIEAIMAIAKAQVRSRFHCRQQGIEAYDGEEFSTWDEFARTTGFNLREAIIDAVPVKSRRL
jgi:hypothetical protein